jgi:hypothetical protein
MTEQEQSAGPTTPAQLESDRGGSAGYRAELARVDEALSDRSLTPREARQCYRELRRRYGPYATERDASRS